MRYLDIHRGSGRLTQALGLQGKSMGTWAIHSFGNDDAADLVGDLVEQSSFAPAQDAIARVVGSSGYLEAPDAQMGIAACEIVATVLGRACPAAQEKEALMAWVARANLSADSKMVSQAIQAIDRVLGPNSELRELWEESPEFGDWQSNVNDLRARLQA
ncbi:DUF4259 domain-containing protein [Burkholderia pseudomallei]